MADLIELNELPSKGGGSASRVAGLAAFHQRRKRDNRKRLLEVAMIQFCERGYFPVSVDEIASAAGLSRMTFYRHFGSKVDLASDLFKAMAKAAMPRYLLIASIDYENRAVIKGWIKMLFEADQANRSLLRVFVQATTDDGGFAARAQEFIGGLISALGASIPAFAANAHQPNERRRWLEAWLLLYEILDQSNHAALRSGVASDPLVIRILADRFFTFVYSNRSVGKQIEPRFERPEP